MLIPFSFFDIFLAVAFCLLETKSETHYIAKDDFELLILLSPYPKGWDYKYMLPCPIYVMLGIEPRALRILGK